MDSQVGVKGSRRRRGEWTAGHDPRVRDQDVDATERCQGLVDECVRLLRVTDI
jgi:hypothetical protein